MELKGSDERWENWVQFTQSRIVPKFTEKGFAVHRTPVHLQARLRKVMRDAIDRWDELPEELGVSDSIYNANNINPKFIDWKPIWDVTHKELLPLHERWAGVELFPTSIYGIRLYRNLSSLVMHYDKVCM